MFSKYSKIQHLNHHGNGIKYNLKFQSNHCPNGYNEENKWQPMPTGIEEIKNPCSLLVEV